MCLGIESNVRMLWSRSLSLMSTTRTSYVNEVMIFLKFSACILSAPSIWSNLVRPSTTRDTFSPNISLMSSKVYGVSSTTSCSRAQIMEVRPRPMSCAAMVATSIGW